MLIIYFLLPHLLCFHWCRILQASFSDLCPKNNDNVSSELDANVQSSEFKCRSENMPLTSDSIPVEGSMDMSETEQEESSICAQPDNVRGTLVGISERLPSSVHKSVNPGRQASHEDIKSWKEKGFTR